MQTNSCSFEHTKSWGADSQNESWPQKHAYAAFLTHKKIRRASVMLTLHEQIMYTWALFDSHANTLSMHHSFWWSMNAYVHFSSTYMQERRQHLWCRSAHTDPQNMRMCTDAADVYACTSTAVWVLARVIDTSQRIRMNKCCCLSASESDWCKLMYMLAHVRLFER